MVGYSTIVTLNSAHHLGVIFDKCMKLDYHTISVCKATYFHRRNIGFLRVVSLHIVHPLEGTLLHSFIVFH